MNETSLNLFIIECEEDRFEQSKTKTWNTRTDQKHASLQESQKVKVNPRNIEFSFCI